MKKPRMGLHTQAERDQAYRRAQQALRESQKVSYDSPARQYHLGYLQAIADMAWDEGEEDLAGLVQEMWLKAQEDIPWDIYLR